MRLLDGPLGTELLARGVPTPIPLWSAWALKHQPEAVRRIHADYAAAGATVHTANTFRTKRRQLGEDWEVLARRAVTLCREAIPVGHLVAGSIAPLADCYRPDLSPADPRPEHRELAQLLAEEGCDILLCETFPHVGEGLIAVEEAARTGVETWASFTAGPEADLLSPERLAEAARAAVDRGASAVLVNCVPASVTLAYVRALSEAVDVPIGAYANAGHAEEQMGWTPSPQGLGVYVDHARTWKEAGATLLGSCCGTGPAHIGALRDLLD
jgi:S-methylmethionine-dependent homocysteine/selenocysteine methylase